MLIEYNVPFNYAPELLLLLNTATLLQLTFYKTLSFDQVFTLWSQYSDSI